jgi:flagellar basal-body rod protein FlgG
MPIRTNGMTSAAGALRYWERRQEAVANNLANVSTTGFKAERVFARMVSDGLSAADSATDHRDGNMRETGQPLDLATSGAHYFVVSTPNGERLSRGGSFHVSDAGHVVDAGGNELLGDKGPITATRGAVTIDKQGAVRVDGREAGLLRMETADAATPLQHDGPLWMPPAKRVEVAPADRAVRQGALEDSNVSQVGALVDMIAVQRAYAAVQKALTTLDATRGSAVNEIGKPV